MTKTKTKKKKEKSRTIPKISIKQEKAFEGSLKVSSCGRLSLVASITWLQNYKQGSVLQRFHFQSWRWLTAAGFQSNRTWWQSRSTISGSFLLLLSNWPTSYCCYTAEQTDNSGHWPRKKEEEGEKMRFSLAEFERTQGNSSVSESRSRNTRRHVRRQREEREERGEREEPPDTYPALAVEWLSCRGNFGADAL